MFIIDDILIAALGVLSFSAVGPVAASIAPAWQAAIGAGTAFGYMSSAVFSVLQSAAMGGAGLTFVKSAIVGFAAGAAAVAGVGGR